MVDIIADGLLFIGSFGAGIFCFVLSRKVSKLNQFETGLGGAIAVLSAQVDEMQKTLAHTEKAAKEAGSELERLVEEATLAAGRLDLLLAAAEDLPDQPSSPYETDEKVEDEGDQESDATEPLEFSHQPNKASEEQVSFAHHRRMARVA